MQIHELNDFIGELNAEAYVAVDNGSDTGRVSAPRLVRSIEQALAEAESYLNGRIDNIIAGGTAPSTSEIVDARYGADGITYSSLGDAIRRQISNLKGDLLGYILGERTITVEKTGTSIIPMILIEGVRYTFTNERSAGCTLDLVKSDGTKTTISGGIGASGTATASVSFTPESQDYIALESWCSAVGNITLTSDYSDYEIGNRFLELEPEINTVVSNFKIDLHPSLELGGITISDNGWGYFDDSRRVRTKQGETVSLNPGDTIGLTNYTGVRYYVGWKRSDGSYGSDGWLTNDFTVQEAGAYIVLIANDPDVEQSDVEALGGLLEIVHYYDYSEFVQDNEVEEIASELDSYINYNVKGVNHRGYNSIAPENTIAAYKLSREKGFVYVETDVNYTSDGVLVLLHDDTINRTARNLDGSAINQTINIHDITYDQALAYDFGIYKGSEYAGTTIPTFEEFVSLCRNIGVHPYIELKLYDKQEYIADAINIVKKYGMLDKVTWISTVPDDLNYIKNSIPNARLGYVVNSITTAVISNAISFKTETNDVFIDSNSYTDAECQLCISAGIPLEVWTYNQLSEIISMNSYISGVSSDTIVASRVLYDHAMNF